MAYRAVQEIDAALLELAPWNPNEQDTATFNAQVASLKADGMVEYPVVIPHPEQPGKYLVVSGNHRAKAAMALGWEQIPVVVAADWDEAKGKAMAVTMNVIRGRINPVKFTQIAKEFVDKYGKEATRELLKIPTQDAFDKLYMELRRTLPPAVTAQLDAKRKNLKTVKDLASVLEEIMARSSGSVQQSFVIFSYAGREHFYLAMTAEIKRMVWRLKHVAVATQRDMNDVLLQAMKEGWFSVTEGVEDTEVGVEEPAAPIDAGPAPVVEDRGEAESSAAAEAASTPAAVGPREQAPARRRRQRPT